MHGPGYLLWSPCTVCAVCELECDAGLGSCDGVWDTEFQEVVAARVEILKRGIEGEGLVIGKIEADLQR